MTVGFRDEFKYYKRKDVPINLKNVINFSTCVPAENTYAKAVKLINSSQLNKNCDGFFGMLNPSQWEVFEFINKPGLIFIKNPFLTIGQRYWIIRCLKYYTQKPSKLNIDAHNIIRPEEDWWELCQRESNTQEGKITLEKLRWATFGYHHNWDTKEYSEDSKCDFPTDLNLLCCYIANVLNFSNFNAEAAIINMYHFGSSLSGHTDHSEVNREAPLFSFSFGQSAIFLIGGTSIEDEAIPILLESGDIVIMSGESRLCYHGVPRILPAEKKTWHCKEESMLKNYEEKHFVKEIVDNVWDEKFWKPFESYVNDSRINMNVRQVLLPGQVNLSS